MTTPPNAPDHGCSCGRPDCQYDKAWGNPLRETQSDQARTAVAELLTREAALAAEVAGLREDIADRNRTIECKNIDLRERDRAINGWATTSREWAERAKKAEDERDALTAEVGALTSARDAYRTMLWQAEEDVKALLETLGLFANDAQRWSEVERRFNDSKTSAASMALEGLGLEPTPYRDFAETVDAARAEPGT